MSVQPEEIEQAFSTTCQHSNGYLIEECLKDERGEKTNTVYSILETMQFNGSKFGVILISSDGGVRDFFVTRKFGDFCLLVQEFQLSGSYPFNDVKGFCTWLNAMDKKILAFSMLESLNS